MQFRIRTDLISAALKPMNQPLHFTSQAEAAEYFRARGEHERIDACLHEKIDLGSITINNLPTAPLPPDTRERIARENRAESKLREEQKHATPWCNEEQLDYYATQRRWNASKCRFEPTPSK